MTTRRTSEPLLRRRAVWIPVVLSSLALFIVIAGVGVGHFYWTGLRGSMDQMDATLSIARDRQQTMMQQFVRAQEMLLERRGELDERSENLQRRERALSAERRLLETEREALASSTAASSAPAPVSASTPTDTAQRMEIALRTLETARNGALKGLAPQDVGALIDVAEELLTGIPDALEAPMLETIAVVRERLDQVAASDALGLLQRLEALETRAAGLSARQPGAARHGFSASRRGARSTAFSGLAGQLETARFALRNGDEALYRLALETSMTWLDAFFDPVDEQVRLLSQDLGTLSKGQLGADLSAVIQAIDGLRRSLDRALAEQDAARR